ncbi:MAG: iron ABC transporter permease [Betaproteobacteria bacterium]|nr:MAG: iron ABC transporter permease [Betaproteobacteria bacterium]
MIRKYGAIALWLCVGAAGFLIVPWYALPGSVLSLDWLRDFATGDSAPAIVQAWRYGRTWLLPIGALLAAGCTLLAPRFDRSLLAHALLALGGIGFLYTLAQGFLIGSQAASLQGLATGGQQGMGLGATLALTSFAMLFAVGLAGRGYFGGDAFIAGSVVAIVASTAIFTLFPVLRIMVSAFDDANGLISIAAFLDRLLQQKVWGLGCLTGAARCGVAWNTLILALLTAGGTTTLGLAFALLVTRTRFRFKKLLRALAILPIITPPFVIGLGLILLFGRSGLVNHGLEWAFGIEPSRWLYGLPGLLLAQWLSFTPIAFLVLIGVVEAVSPSMEEAAQTLRASRWRTFIDVSLPLMRPGLANAFLIGFIESISDFGNPIVLGGNFSVLATEVFFSVVGAQLDQGRAAALGILLLAFALAAFFAQRVVLGRRDYTALSGKGDSGLPAPLPEPARKLCYALAMPWIVLTVTLYAMTFLGSFVEQWGRNYAPTLNHYARAFGVEIGPQGGLIWVGSAWNSLWTTVKLSALAAPLTAALGLLTAYILTRQRFRGRTALEFGTMLSFAIPGTVIGVSYILAFNVPPIEMTGTALILIACNVFRNMPVGVRAGMASMAQIDASLDEASATLGAGRFTTLRRIVLPLLKPAVAAALVYSFVRAATTVSAIVFLVSAEYEWATTYIINRVTNGDYGVAIAYSTVLIVLMLVAIWLIHSAIGERRLGRRDGVVRMGMAELGPAA